MSEALTLFRNFTVLLDSLAKLFEMRAAKARIEAMLDAVKDDDFLEGYAAAHAECANEVREAAATLRKP